MKYDYETKKAEEHEDETDALCNWHIWNDPERFEKGTGRVGNQRMDQDHTNYSIVDIGQNTEKSAGDLWKHDITQTPVE